jgi:hypothetical protein
VTDYVSHDVCDQNEYSLKALLARLTSLQVVEFANLGVSESYGLPGRPSLENSEELEIIRQVKKCTGPVGQQVSGLLDKGSLRCQVGFHVRVALSWHLPISGAKDDQIVSNPARAVQVRVH